MDEIRQKYIEINKRIFNLRDGEVREMQKKYGANYKKSLGVPIVSLQTIAREFEASHALAELLWNFGGREQTLLAAILDEPEKVDIVVLEKYLLKTDTPELWEQIARQLLRKLPQQANLINRWLEREEEVLHIFAVLLLGYIPTVFSDKIASELKSVNVKEGSYLQKCMQRVLFKIGVKEKIYEQIIVKHFEDNPIHSGLIKELMLFRK